MAEYLAQVQGGAGDDSDDDDEEAEFQPGVDDDEEEFDDDDAPPEEEEDDDNYVWIKGTLSYKYEKLTYKGHALKDIFEFHSKPIHFDFQQPTAVAPNQPGEPSRMRTISMEGTIGTYKTELELNFMLDDTSGNQSSLPAEGGKSTGLDDDDDDDDDDVVSNGKMPSKPAATSPNGKSKKTINVYGSGKDASGPFELQGTLSISEETKVSTALDCKKRAVAEQPAAAAAAAAAAPPEENDDSDDEPDEGFDYNELLDLHADAGLSLADLRKRYAEGGDSSRSKRTRSSQPSTSAADEKAAGVAGDEESDEDYGF
jgi:hypothetical protein